MREGTGPLGRSALHPAPEEATNPKRSMGSGRAEASANEGSLGAVSVRGAEKILASSGTGSVRGTVPREVVRKPRRRMPFPPLSAETAIRTPVHFENGPRVWISWLENHGTVRAGLPPAQMRGTVTPLRENMPRISNTRAIIEVNGGVQNLAAAVPPGFRRVAVFGRPGGGDAFASPPARRPTPPKPTSDRPLGEGGRMRGTRLAAY